MLHTNANVSNMGASHFRTGVPPCCVDSVPISYSSTPSFLSPVQLSSLRSALVEAEGEAATWREAARKEAEAGAAAAQEADATKAEVRGLEGRVVCTGSVLDTTLQERCRVASNTSQSSKGISTSRSYSSRRH